MKLVSVKILGKDFRSLTANYKYEFKETARDSRLSPKCFAGLNGSGKSNMLELLSELFYYLDYFHLAHGDEIQKEGKGFGFEIEYLLPMSKVNRELLYGDPVGQGNWMRIQINKEIDGKPEFSLKPNEIEKFDFRTVEKLTHLLLPTNIVAYTSGQNELVSNPFYKLKYHYFREVSETGVHPKTSNRMFFIDDTSNFNVFLANFLIGDSEKLKKIKAVYDISGLNSFRITINLHNYDYKNIERSVETNKIIDKLIACTTCWDIQKVYQSTKKEQLVLDYRVTPVTLKAFDFHFDGSAMNLFRALYKLEMLNIHMQRPKVKDLVHNAPKWLNISDEIASIDPNDQIFRLEKIMIDKIIDGKTYKTEPINYKNLSDGEHQFNEVIGSMMLMDEPGSLLLFDEPDTHFNPKWRSNIMSLFNEMSATHRTKEGKITKVLEQEVIITTHSPFAISDSFNEDVYLFKKKDGKVTIKNPDKELIYTYGASVETILEHIFERDHSIADLANSDLEDMKAKTRSMKQIKEAKSKLSGFGESMEKFDAISYLFAKEERFEENAKKKAKMK
jgi:restriction system-associated AAA family ATPase